MQSLARHNHITPSEFMQRYRITSLDLSQYTVLIRCRHEDGCFFQYPIRIFACHTKPLSGIHYVQIMDQAPFWVQSLTCLKRNFFPCTDTLSFERSAYIVFPVPETEESVWVLLKDIRLLITLPEHQESEMKIWSHPQQHYLLHYPCKTKASSKSETVLKCRTQQQIRKGVQMFITSYRREQNCDLYTAIEHITKLLQKELEEFQWTVVLENLCHNPDDCIEEKNTTV